MNNDDQPIEVSEGCESGSIYGVPNGISSIGSIVLVWIIGVSILSLHTPAWRASYSKFDWIIMGSTTVATVGAGSTGIINCSAGIDGAG